VRIVLASLLVAIAPGIARAQYMGGPEPGAPEAPRTLDPGNESKPYEPPPPPTPQAQKPTVMVVGPDGKVTVPGEKPPEPTGYYADGAAPQVPDESEATALVGPTPELHVVRTGDTLWDICAMYFNDPWQWPKIWSYNAQITNPHWIYPGDLVRLLPRGVFASTAGPTAPETATGSGSGSAQQPDAVPPPAQQNQVGIKQVAFVEKAELDTAITIDGGVDEKALFGLGDQVYLRYSNEKVPQVGKRYSIYTTDHPVKANGNVVGAYVHVLGEVEVTSVKQDKRAKGILVGANQEIERGAKVGPLIKQYRTLPPVPPKVDAQGNIIAILTPAMLIGKGELVFVDLGEGSGLEIGNRMFVIRRGDGKPAQSKQTIGQNDPNFPARALGEISIVEIGKNMSVGLITLSVQEMGVGDLVMMQKH
jgi:hypothetical protein